MRGSPPAWKTPATRVVIPLPSRPKCPCCNVELQPDAVVVWAGIGWCPTCTTPGTKPGYPIAPTVENWAVRHIFEQTAQHRLWHVSRGVAFWMPMGTQDAAYSALAWAQVNEPDLLAADFMPASKEISRTGVKSPNLPAKAPPAG